MLLRYPSGYSLMSTTSRGMRMPCEQEVEANDYIKTFVCVLIRECRITSPDVPLLLVFGSKSSKMNPGAAFDHFK